MWKSSGGGIIVIQNEAILAGRSSRRTVNWTIPECGYGAGYPYGTADPITGYVYYGRADAQLTWSGKYQQLGNALGYDLYHNPDLALDPTIAYKVMSYGMRNGAFTGVGLGLYITDANTDYLNARRVINGTDRAQDIATDAAAFEAILRAEPLVTSLSVASPTISPEGGTYLVAGESGFGSRPPANLDAGMAAISLACLTSGSSIYYTTDGTIPTMASTLYTGPFVVSQSTMVKATAFRSGYTPAGVSSASFAFVSSLATLGPTFDFNSDGHTRMILVLYDNATHSSLLCTSTTILSSTACTVRACRLGGSW